MKRELQLYYTIAQLSALVSMDPRTVVKWLENNDVPIALLGRLRIVWLADLFASFPEMERSLSLLREASADT